MFTFAYYYNCKQYLFGRYMTKALLFILPVNDVNGTVDQEYEEN